MDTDSGEGKLLFSYEDAKEYLSNYPGDSEIARSGSTTLSSTATTPASPSS